MQQNLPELPIEIWQIIIRKSNNVYTIESLFYVCHDFHLMITQCLNDPNFLLRLLCQFSKSHYTDGARHLLDTWYQPETKHYRAIEQQANESSYSGLVCYALMTKDVNKINWDTTLNAIHDIAKLRFSGFSAIRTTLSAMLDITSCTDQPSAIKQWTTYEGFKKYPLLNLSGFYFKSQDFSGVTFSYAKLYGASFMCATLPPSIFDRTDIRFADFRWAKFNNDFGFAHWQECRTSATTFICCDPHITNEKEVYDRLTELSRLRMFAREKSHFRHLLFNEIIHQLYRDDITVDERCHFFNSIAKHPFFSTHRKMFAMVANGTNQISKYIGSFFQRPVTVFKTSYQNRLYSMIEMNK